MGKGEVAIDEAKKVFYAPDPSGTISARKLADGSVDFRLTALIPDGWFDAWADATWATDSEGAKANPPYIRAPNGVIQYSQDYWAAGKAYYDPAKITVPTLLVQAEWDRDRLPAVPP